MYVCVCEMFRGAVVFLRVYDHLVLITLMTPLFPLPRPPYLSLCIHLPFSPSLSASVSPYLFFKDDRQLLILLHVAGFLNNAVCVFVRTVDERTFKITFMIKCSTNMNASYLWRAFIHYCPFVQKTRGPGVYFQSALVQLSQPAAAVKVASSSNELKPSILLVSLSLSLPHSLCPGQVFVTINSVITEWKQLAVG